MTPRDLLRLLTTHQVGLFVQSGKLRFRARPGSLTAALRAALSAHKPELLALLADDALRAAFGIPVGVSIDPHLAVLIAWYRLEADAWPAALREAWEERAAIMEQEGEMPRWQAELLAADEICAVYPRAALAGAAEAEAA